LASPFAYLSNLDTEIVSQAVEAWQQKMNVKAQEKMTTRMALQNEELVRTQFLVFVIFSIFNRSFFIQVFPFCLVLNEIGPRDFQIFASVPWLKFPFPQTKFSVFVPPSIYFFLQLM
jgi:hypothetical protein